MKPIERTHIILIVLGVACLLAGTLVYLTDRPPEATYFVHRSPVPVHFTNTFPHLFGDMGFYLPSFAHAFSFVLITVGILACTTKGALAVALGWFAVDGLFELGQKYGATVAAYVPDWFRGIPFLENTAGYFRHGTFDSLDICAAAAGAAAAYLVVLALDFLARKRGMHSLQVNQIPQKGNTP